MSALAWLFGLGAATIALPILFHLIRRTPQGQQQFSSLMFLRPSPPTLTRRSRLENLLLLLLRAAAIALIAFAFMRPFFRSTVEQSFTQVANRRVAILVDTSASMKRDGLWKQAVANVNQILNDLEDGDDVSLITFDENPIQHIAFDEQSTTVSAEDDPAAALNRKKKEIRDSIAQLEPGWARSDLGTAMTTVADQLDIWRDGRRSDNATLRPKLQLVVVSDLQQGSQTDALQSYQWPADMFVQFDSVSASTTDNATVQLLNPVKDEPDVQRIRVENNAGSSVDQFEVTWTPTPANQSAMKFYVPAGNSRVLKLERESSLGATQFSVAGDSEPFDNQFFVVPTVQQNYDIVYIGDGAQDDPNTMRYYLERSFVETPSRKVTLRFCGPDDSLKQDDRDPTLVVVTKTPTGARLAQLIEYLQRGGTALVVLARETTQGMANLAGISTFNDPEPGSEKDSQRKRRTDYAMLADIKFEHPLFAPFANPRFNDFTKIRFWTARDVSVDEESATVIAKLDNDIPLLWTRKIKGQTGSTGGDVYVLSSGWHPDESQLALSTKFVPLINNLVDLAAKRPEVNQSLRVNQPIELPQIKLAGPVIITPDGDRIDLDDDARSFTETTVPGIYTLETKSAVSASAPDENSWTFAVNVDRAESDANLIPVEQLEMFGVKVGQQETASAEVERLRQLRDLELEDSQKIWKWMIVAAIALLIVETWLAGRTASISATPSVNLTGDAA